MPKFSKLSKSQINALCIHSLDYIEDIFDKFEIPYRINNDCLLSICPIHEGDNPTAINLYLDPDNEIPSSWVCNTRGCQHKYWPNIIGFLHGIFVKENEDQSINDTIRWLMHFTNFDNTVEYKDVRVKIKKKDIGVVKKQSVVRIPRDKVIRSLLIPSKYYVNEKYSSYILRKYDVGYHNKYFRTFFPVYDDNYKNAVGFVSRSVFPKCSKCSGYHHPNSGCPQYLGKNYVKWVNSPTNFPKSQYLFNHWFAKPYLKSTKTAIIVEGPGDVLRLEDNNIHNTVAVFGTSLSILQQQILEKDGVTNLVVLFDNDNAGIAATNKLTKKLSREFNIITPKLIGSDIGEGNKQDIELIKRINNEQVINCNNL